MKPQEIKNGMKVVATTLPNATVYTVKAIKNFSIELCYIALNGDSIDAGTLDACFLNCPTTEQLAKA